MNASAWELVAPLGAGSESIAYRARLEDGTPVEVRTLAGATHDPIRWPQIVRRLRLAQLLQHRGARRVLALHPEGDPPVVVLAWSDAPALADSVTSRLPLPAGEVVALGLALAGVLGAAHHLGLGHGLLSPGTVRHGVSPLVEVDFTASHSNTPVEDLPEDVAGFARLLGWLLSGQTVRDSKAIPAFIVGPMRGLLADMLAPAGDRPGIVAVERRLREIASLYDDKDNVANTRMAVNGDAPAPAAPCGGEPIRRLGRFALLEKLGAGGMGEVYRAEDMVDGSIVAIKTLLPEFARNPEMLRRFVKESRLLAEVRSPHVARLLEVNEDGDQHYIAVEFVPGPPLSRLVERRQPLPERLALAIAADVCRALIDIHQRGILHRDIKPDNILLTIDPSAINPERLDLLPVGPLAKLSDFGLARHREQSESMSLTSPGAVVGTPLYFSPEQCTGAELDARSDLYSLGATLFHLLTGRPPFLGDSPLALIHQHCNVPVASPQSIVGSLSDGACRIVEKALAKPPADRHADAEALLRDIDAHLVGKPSSLGAHPRLPVGDPARVLAYDFEWGLASSPAELWPFVSNTERLNRAIHLPAVEWATAPDDLGRVRRQGKLRKLGLEAAWEEHPFEWVEGRRFGVLREFSSGPFRWLVSVVELVPRPAGGTTLTHRIRVEPAGILGRAFAAVEVGIKTRRNLDRVYQRIDAVIRHQAGASALTDPFEETRRLSRAQQQRLDDGLDALARRGVEPILVEQLGAYLATAPAQEVGRIRPVALARRLKLDADATCAACLHAANAGLLILSWDLLCPLCRIPAQLADALKAVREHARCPACAADFAVDFSQTVELIFRVHPSIREAETGVYCIGGPAHSPHVVAQIRVAPGERIELSLELAAGAYRLRGPQLPTAIELRVEPGTYPARWEFDLARMQPAERTTLRPGAQVLAVHNSHDHELVVRLERTAQRDDALTAARVTSLALFRELFPGEVLGPGQLVVVSTVTLLATELSALRSLAQRHGDNRAFAVLHEHLRQLESLARQHGGALLKAVGDGAVAAFHHPADAVRVALALSGPDEAGLKLALHQGPALAATINDRLDYFGGSVRQLLELLGQAQPGERLLGQSVTDDPSVGALLRRQTGGGTLRRLERGGDYGLVV